MPRPGSRAPHACMYHASTRRHAPRGPAAPAFAPRRVLAAPSPVDPRLPTTPTSAHHRTTPLPLRPHAPRACMYHASARRHAPHPGSRPPHTRPAPRPRSLARPIAPRITSSRNPTCRAPALARRTPPALTRPARPTSARAPHPHTPRLCAAPHTPPPARTTPPRGATRPAPAPRSPAPAPPPHIPTSSHTTCPRASPPISPSPRSPRSPHRAPLIVSPIAPRPRAVPSRPRAAAKCFT